MSGPSNRRSQADIARFGPYHHTVPEVPDAGFPDGGVVVDLPPDEADALVGYGAVFDTDEDVFRHAERLGIDLSRRER